MSTDELTIDDVTVTTATTIAHEAEDGTLESHVLIGTADHGPFLGHSLEEELGVRAVYEDEERAERQANSLAN